MEAGPTGLVKRAVALSSAQKAAEAQHVQRHVRMTHHSRSFKTAIPEAYSSSEAAAIYGALQAMPVRTPTVGYRVRVGSDVTVPAAPLWDDGGPQWQAQTKTLTSQDLPQKFALPKI